MASMDLLQLGSFKTTPVTDYTFLHKALSLL